MRRLVPAAAVFDAQRDIVRKQQVDGHWQVELSCGHTVEYPEEPPARPRCIECLVEYGDRLERSVRRR